MGSGRRASLLGGILAALAAVIALAWPATSRAGSNASSALASPTPVQVGVMGAGLRNIPQLVPAASSQGPVCPSGTPLQGIDVSYYQGSAQNPPTSINWPLVAQSGISFAYARAADGVGFSDPDFYTNYTGIKSVGMKAGAYLFYEPNQDPTQQANVLVAALRNVGFAAGDLDPVFDVEVTDGQSPATIAADLQTSINVVQQSLGATPAIYTGSWFWNPYVQSTAFGVYPLWIAYWSSSCPTPATGWSTWSVWQYSDTSTVNGISGNVDADKSNGGPLPFCGVSPAVFRLTPSAISSGRVIYLPVVANGAGAC